jgi:O-antigen/teichoic acid export membrane protein
MAIPIARDEASSDALMILAVCLSLASGFAAALAIWPLIAFFSESAIILSLGRTIWWLPAGIALVGAYQVFAACAIRRNDMRALGATKVTQSIFMAAIQVGTGIFSASPAGLVLGHIIGQASGVARLSRDAFRDYGRRHRQPSWARICSEAWSHRRFPLYSAPAAVANACGLQLITIVFTSLYGPSAAGWLALSQRVVQLPLIFISGALSQVYFAKVSRLMHENPSEVARLFRNTTTLLLAFSMPLIFFPVIAPDFFAIMFGSNWRAAGVYAQWLTAPALLGFVATPTSNLNTFGYNHWQLLWDFFRLAITTSVLYICYLKGGSPADAIRAYACTAAGSYLALILLNYFAAHAIKSAPAERQGEQETHVTEE